MKVAIISSSFFESTFPLAKYLSGKVTVDLYCVVQMTHLNPPMLNISDRAATLKCGIYSNAETLAIIPDYIQEYFENQNITLRLIIFSGGKKIIPDLRTIKELVRELKDLKYDIYHFIGNYVLYPLIERGLNPHHTIHTLHESSDRLFELEPSRIKRLFISYQFLLLRKRPIRLIFHSENVRKSFHQKYLKSLLCSRFIPFGLFESYEKFPGNSKFIFPDKKYYLFIGYIHPYKGVDSLLEAARSISAKEAEVYIVIAGKDTTNLRNRLIIPNNVHLIDRYLSEEEIVTLTKHCYAIVLPYLSASQSGIPNTCFCFNKPIIASNLDGINQIVLNEVNGMLYEAGNSTELEGLLLHVWNDTDLYNQLVSNIKARKNMRWANWDEIAEKTKNWYTSVSVE
jgi:glycosyltransferase involved in cell wall biosynthesis